MHFVLTTTSGKIPDVNVADIERRLMEAGRTWADRLNEALIRVHGERSGSESLRRFANAFPPATSRAFPQRWRSPI